MDAREAERALEGAELVPALQASLGQAKEILEACLDASIPALLGRDGGCATGGCSPKVQLFVRPSDLEGLREVLERQWAELLEREGTALEAAPEALGEDEEPPCPACGTALPLVEGACSDCGLQLA